MIRLVFTMALLMGAAVLALAYLPAHAAVDESAAVTTETMAGVLVDNACASGHKHDLAQFVKEHTKDCALMPGCIASGYSLYTRDGTLLAFGPDSNQRIVSFLTRAESTLQVDVTVRRNGGKLELVSIKNRKA